VGDVEWLLELLEIFIILILLGGEREQGDGVRNIGFVGQDGRVCRSGR
jgi:hypothetical protein